MRLKGRPPEDAGELAISESLARRFWASADQALGERLSIGLKTYTITGIAGDRVTGSLSLDKPQAVYYPLGKVSPRWWPFLLIRSTLSRPALTREVRSIVSLLGDPRLVVRIQSMTELRANQLSTPRLLAGIFVFLAGLLAVISVVGVFATVHREMSQRQREIAIRTAFGARPRTVCRQMLSEVALVCLPAVALGSVAGYRLLARTHELLGVKSLDLLSAGLAVTAALAVVALAALLPIRKAASANASDLLRTN